MTNEELAIQIQQGEKQYTAVLWEKVNKLMYKILYKYSFNRDFPTYIDNEDLQQELYFAFLTAVKSYKADKGYKFNSYLDFSVRNILNRDVASKSQRTIKESSYNQCVGDEDDTELIELVEDTASQDFVYDVELIELQREVRNAVERLPGKECKVMQEYYFNKRTYKEIANNWDCTIENIRQFINKGMRTLRKDTSLRNYYIQCYGNYVRHRSMSEITFDNQLYYMWSVSEDRAAVLKHIKELRQQGYTDSLTAIEVYENAKKQFYKRHRNDLYIRNYLAPQQSVAKYH